MKLLDRLTSPKLSGILGMLGVGWFMLLVAILNFVTPGYSIVKFTVSALAIHKYGDLYTVSMFFFAFTTFILGLGLNKKLAGRLMGVVSYFFTAFALGILILAIFKMDLKLDSSYFNLAAIHFPGQIHFYTTLSALFIFPVGLWFILKEFAKSSWWKKMIPYSIAVLVTGFVMGGIWFILFFIGTGYAWKGVFQKIVIYDLLIWTFMIGCWLYREEQK